MPMYYLYINSVCSLIRIAQQWNFLFHFYQQKKRSCNQTNIIFNNFFSVQILLNGRNNEPCESLVHLINAHCSVSPLSTIRERLDNLGEQFQRAYAGLKSINSSGVTITPTANNLAISAAQQRLQLCYPLYYMALENILLDEIRRIEKKLVTTTPTPLSSSNNSNKTRRTHPDLTTLLAQDTFHRALFICCMEIVMVSCDPPNHHFPWILEALSLDSVQFFKVSIINILCILGETFCFINFYYITSFLF